MSAGRGSTPERSDPKAMVQHGQTFELRRRGTSGERLWAYRYRAGGQHDVQPVTIEKLRYLLSKDTVAFGERCVGELTSQEIAAWRMTLSPGYRFEATQALRQVLHRAVAWGSTSIRRRSASTTRAGGGRSSGRSSRGRSWRRSPRRSGRAMGR